MRFTLRAGGGASAGGHPDARPASRPQRAGRGRVGLGGRAHARRDRDRARRRLVARRIGSRSSGSARDGPRRQLQRVARLDARRARAARRPARPPRGGPRRDAGARRCARGRPPRGRARPRPGSPTCSSSSARRAAGIAEAAADAGLAPDRVLRSCDAASALEVLRPRLRDGDVVLVKASRGDRRSTRSSMRCAGWSRRARRTGRR